MTCFSSHLHQFSSILIKFCRWGRSANKVNPPPVINFDQFSSPWEPETFGALVSPVCRCPSLSHAALLPKCERNCLLLPHMPLAHGNTGSRHLDSRDPVSQRRTQPPQQHSCRKTQGTAPPPHIQSGEQTCQEWHIRPCCLNSQGAATDAFCGSTAQGVALCCTQPHRLWLGQFKSRS